MHREVKIKFRYVVMVQIKPTGKRGSGREQWEFL